MYLHLSKCKRNHQYSKQAKQKSPSCWEVWSWRYLFHSSQQPSWRKVEKDYDIGLDLLCVSKGLGLEQELMNVVGKVIQATRPCELSALWHYIFLETVLAAQTIWLVLVLGWMFKGKVTSTHHATDAVWSKWIALITQWTWIGNTSLPPQTTMLLESHLILL